MALLGSETRDALCSTLAGGGCGRWAAAIGRVGEWKWGRVVESEGRARISRESGRRRGFLESSGRREEGIAGVQ